MLDYNSVSFSHSSMQFSHKGWIAYHKPVGDEHIEWIRKYRAIAVYQSGFEFEHYSSFPGGSMFLHNGQGPSVYNPVQHYIRFHLYGRCLTEEQFFCHPEVNISEDEATRIKLYYRYEQNKSD